MNYVSIVLAEKGFGRGTNTQPLAQLLLAAVGNPGHFGGKPFNMILLFLEQAFGNKHGHHDIFVTQLFKSGIQVFLYIFPNGVSVGAYYHTTL